MATSFAARPGTPVPPWAVALLAPGNAPVAAETRVRGLDAGAGVDDRGAGGESRDGRWGNGASYDGKASGSTQFVTRDPAVGRTRTPYGYATGDPLSLSDPMGLDASPAPTCEAPGVLPQCGPQPPKPDGFQFHATAFVTTKDIVGIPLTSEWLTVAWNSNGSQITGETASIVTEGHDGGFIFGQWTPDNSNEAIYTSNDTGCSSTITGKVGFSNQGGLVDLLGSYYNTQQLSITINGNGSWTYAVNHWQRNDFQGTFKYDWGAWNGLPYDAPGGGNTP